MAVFYKSVFFHHNATDDIQNSSTTFRCIGIRGPPPSTRSAFSKTTFTNGRRQEVVVAVPGQSLDAWREAPLCHDSPWKEERAACHALARQIALAKTDGK